MNVPGEKKQTQEQQLGQEIKNVVASITSMDVLVTLVASHVVRLGELERAIENIMLAMAGDEEQKTRIAEFAKLIKAQRAGLLIPR